MKVLRTQLDQLVQLDKSNQTGCLDFGFLILRFSYTPTRGHLQFQTVATVERKTTLL